MTHGRRSIRTADGGYPSEHIIRFIARNYYRRNRNNIKVLDFGCGAGANTWYLSREGFDTYAFDGSPSAVNNARTKLENEQLHADIRVMDGIAIDYEENYFDAVIDSACITANSIENIKIMYEEIFSILKPEGRLCSIVFGKGTTGYGKGLLIEKDTFTNIEIGHLAGEGKIHFFDKQSLCAVLNNIGYKIISCDTDLMTDLGDDVESIIVQAEKER